MFELKYLTDVVTLELDREKCTGCEMCVLVCPHEVLSMERGKAHIYDRDACIECGACKINCPVSAIEVEAGVGCASGIINGAVKGTEPVCGCEDEKSEERSSCC